MTTLAVGPVVVAKALADQSFRPPDRPAGLGAVNITLKTRASQPANTGTVGDDGAGKGS